jgi:ureidoacrylate peracid hydrolase
MRFRDRIFILHCPHTEFLNLAARSFELSETLDPNTTSILFFDLLNGHVKANNPDTKLRYEPVIRNSVRLLNKARELNLLVAYAAANHRQDNRTTGQTIRDTNNKLEPIKPGIEKHFIHSGTWEAQVIDEIAPREDDFLIPKYRWSAFHQTYLDLALRTQKIETIIICGGSTDVGVASTAFSARDLDYNIVFAEDACTSHQMDGHHFLMEKIFPRMGRVRTTRDILAMLG